MEPLLTLSRERSSLPLIAYELLAQLLAPSDLPSARLSCRHFAEALDGHITRLKIGNWTPVHQLRRLQHVTRVSVNIQTPTEWHQMQQLCSQLPKLQSIAFSGRRTWQQLNSNSTSRAYCEQLVNLKAASFEGIVKGLDDIAALAPKLQHLYCAKLILPEPLNACMPSVTHFGSKQVQFEADGRKEGGQMFAAAFPNLEVMYRTPTFTFKATHVIDPFDMPLKDALACCSKLHSLRVIGDSTMMYVSLPSQLQLLQQIRRVAVYGIGPAAELRGIGRLAHLQHLWLTFQLPAKKAAGQLLQELLQLPELLSLALPAKLLCSKCCSGMQLFLTQLALKHSMNQLVFLRREAAEHLRRHLGDYCPHGQLIEEAFSLLEAELAAAGLVTHSSSLATGHHDKQQKCIKLLSLKEATSANSGFVPGRTDVIENPSCMRHDGCSDVNCGMCEDREWGICETCWDQQA